MKTEDLFDLEEEPREMLESGPEEPDAKESKTQNRTDTPISVANNIMMYASGYSILETDAGVGAVSYSELSETVPQKDSLSEHVSELIDNGFLDVHFYALDKLNLDGETPVIMPESINNTTEEALSYINDEVAYGQDKSALPGINDALISLNPIGRQYIKSRGLEYAGIQAVKADKRSNTSQNPKF